VTVTSVNTVTSATTAPYRDLDRLRETTGQIVGSIFFGTLLKTLRDSKLQGPFGHGGRGEEVFEAQLHGVLAERMGTRMQESLNDALFRQLEKQQRLIGELRSGEPKETDHETGS
jgi:hypothetical protein